MAAVLTKERDQQQMNKLLSQANQELQFQKTALDEHAIVSIADTRGGPRRTARHSRRPNPLR